MGRTALSSRGITSAPELKTRFHDQRWSEDQRVVAAARAGDVSSRRRQDAREPGRHVVAAQLRAIIPALACPIKEAGRLVEAAVESESPPGNVEDGTRPRPARQRCAAAVTALLGIDLGDRTFDELRSGPSPRVRTYLIHELALAGIPPVRLLQGIDDPRLEASVRQALLLALGEYNANMLTGVDQDDTLHRLLKLYARDPDPGVHSAAAWLIRRLRPGECPARPLSRARARSRGRDWYVNRQGQNFAVVRSPVKLTFLEFQ